MTYKTTKFRDIPPFTKSANYHVDVSWNYLEQWLKNNSEDVAVDLDPEFQRAHVWTEQQQIRYVEFILRGGNSSKEIYFNHPNWMGTFEGALVLVDGKQRFEAVRRFMRNEIPAFGTLFKDYTDKIPILDARFSIHVNDLATEAEVLQWYLDLNDGGVAHTSEEIDKVRAMLEELENE